MGIDLPLFALWLDCWWGGFVLLLGGLGILWLLGVVILLVGFVLVWAVVWWCFPFRFLFNGDLDVFVGMWLLLVVLCGLRVRLFRG